MAIGAYQLEQALLAHAELATRGCRSCVTLIIEPGRLRSPRDELEAAFVLDDARLQALFPRHLPRVLLCHTRPEPMLGVLRRLDGGAERTLALGYINRGGTLDVDGMLFANRCTWAHAVEAVAALSGRPLSGLLDEPQRLAIQGQGRVADLHIANLERKI